MASNNHQIIISGAGIAGLTTALACHKLGLQVQILEKTSRLSPLGAGLQLSANALHVMKFLDLYNAVQAVAFIPQKAVIRNGYSGVAELSLPLAGAHQRRYGQPYLHIHRGDFQSILHRAAQDRGINIELNAPVTEFSETENDITAYTPKSTYTGHAFIAADGIKSAHRRAIADIDDLQFTGQTAWRAIIKANKLPPGLIPPDATVWRAHNKHIVTYYLENGNLINLVAVSETKSWDRPDWSTTGDPQELRRHFSDLCPAIQQVLNQVEKCHYWGLFDHRPLKHYHKGRAALIGDAAHPMLPFMAQGAAMSVEDSYSIAACLAAYPNNPEKAFNIFSKRRLKRTQRLQYISRKNAQLYHGIKGINGMWQSAKLTLAQAVPLLAQHQFDKIYSYNVVEEFNPS